MARPSQSGQGGFPPPDLGPMNSYNSMQSPGASAYDPALMLSPASRPGYASPVGSGTGTVKGMKRYVECERCDRLNDLLLEAGRRNGQMQDKLRSQKRTARDLQHQVEELEETLEDVEHRPCNDCHEAKKMLDALAERVKALAEENTRLVKRRDELAAQPPESHVIERVVVERTSHDECRAQVETLEAQLIKERGGWEAEKVIYAQREKAWEGVVDDVNERLRSHMAVCTDHVQLCALQEEEDRAKAAKEERRRRKRESRRR